TLLEGDDGEAIAERREQLTGPQQEIGVGGTAEALVAEHEGLIDQHALRGQRRCQMRQHRAPEIVRDENAVIAIAKPPGAAVLEVYAPDRAGGITREAGLQRGGVAVGGNPL